METIRGTTSLGMTAAELQQQVAGYKQISLDLGTGDGRFVHHMAEKHPEWFFIGVDACRENLYVNSRRKRANVLFIIANAQALPVELNGLVSHITINFPWGSLLHSWPDVKIGFRANPMCIGCRGLEAQISSMDRCAPAALLSDHVGQTPRLRTRPARGAIKFTKGVRLFGRESEQPRWLPRLLH
jgi:predicted RNA methylase